MQCYVVTGDNGVIIQQYYSQAYKCRAYLRKNRIKKYDSFEEAEEVALDHLSNIAPYYIQIPTSIKLNELVTIAKLHRAQQSEK